MYITYTRCQKRCNLKIYLKYIFIYTFPFLIKTVMDEEYVYFSLKEQYLFCYCGKEKQNSYCTSLLKNFPLIYSVSILLMEKEMVYISHIISNFNVVENGRVNKCKFMFHFVIFFSNQDSAERNDVRFKTASEVPLVSARMLCTEMEQLTDTH